MTVVSASAKQRRLSYCATVSLILTAHEEVAYLNKSRRSQADKNTLELRRRSVSLGDFHQNRAARAQRSRLHVFPRAQKGGFLWTQGCSCSIAQDRGPAASSRRSRFPPSATQEVSDEKKHKWNHVKEPARPVNVHKSRDKRMCTCERSSQAKRQPVKDPTFGNQIIRLSNSQLMSV